MVISSGRALLSPLIQVQLLSLYLMHPAYNSWVFFMEGGGVCVEPIDCAIRKESHLGSSNYWAASFNDEVRTISNDPKVNPFWNWNHVFFPYCTGDTHTGTMTTPDVFGFLFSGHNAINARLAHLEATAHLSNVTHILLSGQSAGGIGVYASANYIQSKYPKAYMKGALKIVKIYNDSRT